MRLSHATPQDLHRSPAEHTAFKFQAMHVSDLAQEASLDAYEAMPIASFGEAMLRGMGWKEGMSVGRNVPKEVSLMSSGQPAVSSS